MRALAAEIRERGYRVIDAPVTRRGRAGHRRHADGDRGRLGWGPTLGPRADPGPDERPALPRRDGAGPGPDDQDGEPVARRHAPRGRRGDGVGPRRRADLQQVYDLLISGQARSEMLVSRARSFLSKEMNTGALLRIFTRRICRWSSTPAANSECR